MTDIKESIRDQMKWLNQGTSTLDEIYESFEKALAEIERLEMVIENYRLRSAHRYDPTKAVIEDMRAWILERHQPGKNSFEMASLRSFVDAYCKDRNID